MKDLVKEDMKSEASFDSRHNLLMDVTAKGAFLAEKI
jgi:hypothetical protein